MEIELTVQRIQTQTIRVQLNGEATEEEVRAWLAENVNDKNLGEMPLTRRNDGGSLIGFVTHVGGSYSNGEIISPRPINAYVVGSGITRGANEWSWPCDRGQIGKKKK